MPHFGKSIHALTICLATLLSHSATAQQPFPWDHTPCPQYGARQFYGPGWSQLPGWQTPQGFDIGSLGGRGYGRTMTSPKMARVIDENQDGLISEDEAAAWHEQAFMMMDRDEDGILTEAEFMSTRLGPGAYRSLTQEQETRRFLKKQHRFQTADPDGDGKVSKADFMASGKQRYQKADLDGDGQVTVWEYRAHRRSLP